MKKVFGLALGILTAIGGFLDIGDLITNAVVGRRPGTPPGREGPRTGVYRSRGRGAAQYELPAAVLRSGCREVGLVGLTPHELRHTAASLAIAAGANVKAVQLMLGHASAAMTLDISVRASSPMTSTLLRTGLTGRS
jgi:integrase